MSVADSVTSFKQLIGGPLTLGSVSGPVRGVTRRRREEEEDDDDDDDYYYDYDYDYDDDTKYDDDYTDDVICID